MHAAQRTRSSLQNPQNPISWQTSKLYKSFVITAILLSSGPQLLIRTDYIYAQTVRYNLKVT